MCSQTITRITHTEIKDDHAVLAVNEKKSSCCSAADFAATATVVDMEWLSTTVTPSMLFLKALL